MNAVTDKMPCETLEIDPQAVKTGQDKKDWTQYSQWIAEVMSKRISELGMTQKMLAEKMSCTQQYISKMLNGKKNMSLETICKIENALGIEIIKGLNENEQ
ncbi:helix-turn-helix transcriptional regulator [uncultured Bacteroides sp.]|uniref:helix-turn-helix domain-containing protein n=1 Tax=uncultured Bacteroides sp. TaxID=162156 RepID=UPI00261CBC27|nr:helix-turn-helix transcriptional regulator [uncultured Bacteroides sp.]